MAPDTEDSLPSGDHNHQFGISATILQVYIPILIQVPFQQDDIAQMVGMVGVHCHAAGIGAST